MKTVTVATILVLIVAIPFIMTKHGKWLLNEDSRYHISDFVT